MAQTGPSKALYFPHLEFGSAAWVKGALLYWEGLARLVGKVQPDDEPEIRELLEAGLIEEIKLEPFKPQVKRLFGDRFVDLLRRCRGLPDAVPRARGLRADLDLQARVLDELAHELESQGHQHASEVVRTMPEQALALAATFAAHVVASEHYLAPVTDDPMFSALDTYFTEEGITSDPKATPDGLAEADLLIPTPSVDALASLPVARLLEIRAKLRKNRRSFRRKVESLRASIAELPTVDAVRDRIRTFAEDIRDDLEAERRAIREAEVKEDWTFMTITAPAALAVGVTIASSSSTILGPVAGIGAVGLGVTNWFVQRRKRPKASSNYMLSLKTELGRRGRGLGSGLDQLLSR
jgi:hypothetical protein